MRDVLTRYGLQGCGHYGEMLQCMLCDILVSMHDIGFGCIDIPLLVLLMRSLGLDRLGGWDASDSGHDGLGESGEVFVAVIEYEVSSVIRSDGDPVCGFSAGVDG